MATAYELEDAVLIRHLLQALDEPNGLAIEAPDRDLACTLRNRYYRCRRDHPEHPELAELQFSVSPLSDADPDGPGEVWIVRKGLLDHLREQEEDPIDAGAP